MNQYVVTLGETFLLCSAESPLALMIRLKEEYPDTYRQAKWELTKWEPICYRFSKGEQYGYLVAPDSDFAREMLDAMDMEDWVLEVIDPLPDMLPLPLEPSSFSEDKRWNSL